MFTLLRAALLSALLSAFLVSGAGAQNAPAQRIAVLLDGYNTASPGVTGTFAGITKSALHPDGFAVVPYSYRYPSPYAAAATYTALPAGGPAALQRTLHDLLTANPDAQIALIGYSLGGAVAIRYLAAYAGTAEVEHVRWVVTLDSPVNGTSHSRLVLLAAAVGQKDLLGSPTGAFLASEHQSRATVPDNEALARRLRATTLIRTIASRDDWIVPPADAAIPGFSRRLSLGRALRACTDGMNGASACLGHEAVLHDRRVMADVRAALQTQPAA